MAEFFTSVIDFFKTLFSTIADVYNAWIDFFSFIPRVFRMAEDISVAMPVFLIPFLGLGLAILVVRVIIDLL